MVLVLNGASAVIRAIEHHVSDRKFVLSVLCAIRQLSSGCEDIIGESGVVAAMKAIMEEHSDDETVVTGAILTLGCLAMNNCVVADTIMLTGGLSALVGVMTRHPCNADLQRTACASIGACALQKDSLYLKDAIHSTPNVIQLVVTAMHQHHKNEKLQIVASLTLKDLVSSVKMGYCFVHSGAVSVLVAAMKQFPLNVGLQAAAVSSIGIIANSDGGIIGVIMASGFVSVLIRSICRLSNHDSFVHSAVRALCAMMKEKNEGVKEQIVSVGGVLLLDYNIMSIEACAVAETRLFLATLGECENDDIRNAAKAALRPKASTKLPGTAWALPSQFK